MTIAIALKIGDGLVLGSDSAVTLANPGSYPDNIYLNAEKIINLVKGLPLGAVTYGLGGFSGRSFTRLAKDLRKRFSDPGHPWWIDPQAYTVEDVAIRVKEFFYDEHYRAAYPEGGEAPPSDSSWPGMAPMRPMGRSGPSTWKTAVSVTVRSKRSPHRTGCSTAGRERR